MKRFSNNDELLVPREKAFDYDYTVQWLCVRVTTSYRVGIVPLDLLCITPPHALFTLPVTIETNNDHSVLIARCVPKRRLQYLSCHDRYVRPMERGGSRTIKKMGSF